MSAKEPPGASGPDKAYLRDYATEGAVRILSRFWKFAWRHRGWMLLGAVAHSASVALLLLLPRVTGLAIDRICLCGRLARVQSFPAAGVVLLITVSSVVLLLGAVLVLAVMQAAIGFVAGLCNARVAEGTAFEIRNELYRALQFLSFGFHDSTHSGQLMSRVTMDVMFINRFFSFGLSAALEFTLVSVGAFLLMLQRSVPLSLAALAVVPVIWLVIHRFKRLARPAFFSVREQYGEMTTALQESIAGVRVVRAFARESDEIERYSGEAGEFRGRVLGAMRLIASNMPLIFFIGACGTAGILYLAGRMVIVGALTLGRLYEFLRYLGMLTDRTRGAGNLVSLGQRAAAAGQRLLEVLDEVPEVKSKPGAPDLAPGVGLVEFEGVTFGYGNNSPVLRDVSFAVKPGETVALVGETGSGKSTIVSLVPRFYDVEEGAIRIDGQDVRDVSLRSLRREVGFVFQEPFLFSATVAENIAYGRPGTGMEAVMECAEAAAAHEFIMELPEGYETVIGERGVTLSGGQRQRLTIARALLKDPRILVFDDWTSSVDTGTENQILDAVESLTAGRTTFIIAHRIASVRNADRIIVLREGRIVEEGSHDELVAAAGLYSELCRMQVSDALVGGSDGEEG